MCSDYYIRIRLKTLFPLKFNVLYNLFIEFVNSLFCLSITVRRGPSRWLEPQPQLRIVWAPGVKARLLLILKAICTQPHFTCSLSASSDRQISRITMPPWFFGYRFKWKHDRRLAREQGFLDEEDVLATEDRVRYFLQSKSKVNIRFESDYKDYIICFHKSSVRSDLSHFKADTMEKIRDVGRIFYGKDHEPRWFAAYNDMGGEDDSSEDEELPSSVAPPGYFDPVVGLPLEFGSYLESRGIILSDSEDEDLTDEEYNSLTKESIGPESLQSCRLYSEGIKQRQQHVVPQQPLSTSTSLQYALLVQHLTFDHLHILLHCLVLMPSCSRFVQTITYGICKLDHCVHQLWQVNLNHNRNI